MCSKCESRGNKLAHEVAVIVPRKKAANVLGCGISLFLDHRARARLFPLGKLPDLLRTEYDGHELRLIFAHPDFEAVEQPREVRL